MSEAGLTMPPAYDSIVNLIDTHVVLNYKLFLAFLATSFGTCLYIYIYITKAKIYI